MSSQLQITPKVTIPDFLVGEVQSKLAYVDENIVGARIASTGDQITLDLREQAEDPKRSELEEKVHRVVTSMVQGAFKPKVQILEDYLDRPVPSSVDPNAELLVRGEMYQEAVGIFTLGPLVTRLISFFERQFIGLAELVWGGTVSLPDPDPGEVARACGLLPGIPAIVELCHALARGSGRN